MEIKYTPSGGGNIFGRSKFIQKKIAIREWDNYDYYQRRNGTAGLFFVGAAVFSFLIFFIMFIFRADMLSLIIIIVLFLTSGFLVVLGFLNHNWENIEFEREYLEFYVPYISAKKRNYFKPLIITLLRGSIANIAINLDNHTIRIENVKIRLRRGYSTEWFMPKLIIKLNLFTDYDVMRLYIWPLYSINMDQVKNELYRNIYTAFKQNGFEMSRINPTYP